MTLSERCKKIWQIFSMLASTSSKNEKNKIIDDFVSDEIKNDFVACIKVLSGSVSFGYTYANFSATGNYLDENMTVSDVLDFLMQPKRDHDLSASNIKAHIDRTTPWAYFFADLVNKTWRLGINKSLLAVTDVSPMLAKKYDGTLHYDYFGYFVTEKLDGNRCIAYFDDKWHFVSRNGKAMNVEFDMTGLPTNYIYDGEILSKDQVEMSNAIYAGVFDTKFNSSFNTTSGLINRLNKSTAKLVYNIFDIISEERYDYRRHVLDELMNTKLSKQIRILPLLCYSETNNRDLFDELLDKVTSIGGEGLMINLGGRPYQHKRTDGLLKYKPVQTMDMFVIDTQPGEGKYDGLVGALCCRLVKDNGDVVTCNVGSGLSDEQRWDWSIDPSKIIGKVVEIAYFSLSQSTDMINTKNYSLRFPRLKAVREDKLMPSEY